MGILPPGGYNRTLHQSFFTKCWLSWIEYEKKISLRRKVPIGPYIVDGLYENNTESTIYEAYGCYYHGHPVCFSGNIMNGVCNHKMCDLFAETKSRERTLQALGYQLVSLWECEFAQMQKDIPQLHQFLTSDTFTPPISPRDAFLVEGAMQHTCIIKQLQLKKIRYYYFCSLYPSVNKYCKYPVEHPTVIKHPQNLDVDAYFVLIKCKILALGTLFHPVLPVKIHGKLKFRLCMKCVEMKTTFPCAHSRKEQTFIGTWVTSELQLAVAKGYIVLQIYEVWHNTESSQYDKNTIPLLNSPFHFCYLTTYITDRLICVAIHIGERILLLGQIGESLYAI